MNKVKASKLLPMQSSRIMSLEGLAVGSILIIEGKQFVVGWLNNHEGTYNFSLLRREATQEGQAVEGGEVILEIWYQISESQASKGLLTQTSNCNLFYPPSKKFETASNRFKELQLKNK